MRPHDKQRDMLRSLLPSTARKSARDDKRIVHKRERAALRQALHPITDCDAAWDTETNVTVDYRARVHDVVRDRRNADKTGPFERWAEAITNHIEDPHDKYWYMAALVPDNLIGRHALTHLPYDWDPGHIERYWRSRALTEAERQTKYLRIYEALYAACGAANVQRRLNDVLKRSFHSGHDEWAGRDERGVAQYTRVMCPNCAAGPRLLLGTGDIADFITTWHGTTVWNRAKRTFWRYGLIVSERTPHVYPLAQHTRRWQPKGPWAAMVTFLEEEGLF